MAIALWVFYQIVLMVVFRNGEVFQRKEFSDDRVLVFLLKGMQGILDKRYVFPFDVVDTGTVLMADVVSLLIEDSRIDDQEEEFQDLVQGDPIFIINDFYGLGRTGAVCLQIFIGWRRDIAVGVTDSGRGNTFDQGEIVFYAPETSSGKIDLFHKDII